MDRLLAERLWGIPWTVLATVALAVMAVYLVLDTSHNATGFSWFVMRWFHSLCWLLLALAALAKAKVTPIPVDWASPIAIAGGITYAVFMAVSVMNGKLGA
jgi:peptidoglycan/LPS O-acetylase OafA/YrhL